MSGNNRYIKIIPCLLISLFFVASAFLLRSPYASDYMKKAVLSEVETAAGLRLTARRMYINIFPLFVEAKDMKAYEKDGSMVFKAKGVKCYIGLSGLLKKKIAIKRLVIKEPALTADRRLIEDAIKHIEDYTLKPGGGFKVDVGSLEIRGGDFLLSDAEKNATVSVKGVEADMIFKKEPELRFSIMEANTSAGGLSGLKGSLKGTLILRKNGLYVKKLLISSYGSKVEASGGYSKDKGGSLSAEINILVDSVKKIFGLRRQGEGRVYAKGKIEFPKDMPKDIMDTALDLNLKGEFYIQTLMELLDVTERVEGLVGFEGRVSGRIPDLKGEAKATLKKGNLFDIDVDDLRCRVIYEKGGMSFKEGKADLYGGEADAEAEIELPVVNRFSLNVDFRDIDSPPVLKLIKFEPGIPYGKVKGRVFSEGGEFDPEGWFEYAAGEELKDVLGRVKEIRGNFKSKGGVINFSYGEARTLSSVMQWEGDVDSKNERLSLKGRLHTGEMTDLSAPYSDIFKGPGDFEGKVTGSFDDPLIEGKAMSPQAYFKGYPIKAASGEISYSKKKLVVSGLDAEGMRLRGDIKFPDALEIFEFENPVYDLSLNIRGAGLKDIVKFSYGDELPVSGMADAGIEIKGSLPLITASFTAYEGSVYEVPFTSAGGAVSYDNKDFRVKDAVLRKGGSVMHLNGSVSGEGSFSFRAWSEGITLREAMPWEMPIDYTLGFEAEGKGTFKDPRIEIKGRLIKGVFKGIKLGSGRFDASLKGRHLAYDLRLLDDRIIFKGGARLEGDMPWSGELQMRQGRYDFVVNSLLKEVPEDMLLTLEGSARLSGDKMRLRASAVISQLKISMFGQSFSNDSDIEFDVEDTKVSVKRLTVRSGNTSFRVSGGLDAGSSYDLVLEGKSSLSPLKGFYREIDVIRGNMDYVFSVYGKWEKPAISGGAALTDATFALKGMTQRLSSINAYIYIDEDRAVIQDFAAKLGGGDVEFKGVAYLKGFGIERFYLDGLLKDITAAIKNDFVVNFGGNIIYKGTPESQDIVGELDINRARYGERVEWKSWLVKARQKELPRAGASMFARTNLNVKIYGPDNIVMDNNIARAQIKVDINLRGTAGGPVLLGRLESNKGKVYFRNNEFEILHAVADFADPSMINPVVDVLAETSVKGYSIRLRLEGQLDRFNLILSSSPVLDEVDILALLTVGRFGEGLKGLEGGIGAAEATAFITGQMQDVVEERLRDITGFDRIQIDPSVSETTGTITPRITVSKRLLGDRLFVTYSTPVGTAEEQVVKLEYLLQKNISLIGIRDEKGIIGGDIKFRFEFR
jgi:translocation and assembly module TamB